MNSTFNFSNSNLNGNEKSKIKLNPLNNNEKSININRTPLQPRHMNKTQLNDESNFKFSTPLKLSNNKQINPHTIQKLTEFTQNNEINDLDEKTEDIDDDYSKMRNDFEEMNAQYNYNLIKNCDDQICKNDCDEYFAEIKLADSVSDNYVPNNNYDIDLNEISYKDNLKDDSPIRKAYEFLENDNIIYINNIDRKNRENINYYLAEGLFFSKN